MSSIINGFIIFSLIITAFYLFGLLNFLTDYEANKCDMTYMFEYPQYVRIAHEIDDKYPKYALYAYSEGSFTANSRNMYFTGIPVLFIPGNAGSHRQARSMASVALRKAKNAQLPFHFDYFAIDVNNEFSGLNGPLLLDQLEYANSSIYRILELYRERKNQPKAVILFAHSVGGIVARRLVESLPEGLIPIVLTLASPHHRIPIILDSYIYDFYKVLNDTKPTNTTFVSVTGGYDDFLVPSYLTTLSYPNAINVATTHIPRAWVSADHICITWCKQVILALNRALFDSVDPKTKQISTDHRLRNNIFHHHLVHHNGLSPFLRDSYKNGKANIRNHGEWIEPMARQYVINVPKHSSSPNFYMLRMLNQPQHETVTVVALNLETVEWAFVCGAHIPRDKARVCEEFTHLSHLSEISPSHHYKRRTLTVNMFDLMKTNPEWSHVVLRVLPSDDDVILHVDVYNPSERKQMVDLPHMLSLKRQTVLAETPEGAVRFELEVPQLTRVMQSYQLFVEALKCTNEMRHATATLKVPWGHQNQHKFFVQGDDEPFNVRLYEPKPQGHANQSAVIELTLDPNCRYKVSIRSWIPGIAAQMARLYSPLLLVNVAAVVLMALNAQLRYIASDRRCSFFFVAVKEGVKPYYILTTVKLLSRFLSAKPFINHLPTPDWLIMSQEGTEFFLLPLLSYICSVGIVWLLGIVLSVSLIVCETTVHKLALKFLAKTVSFTVSWSDYVMSALHKLPCVVAAALIFLSLTTTGSLALCVGTVFYFLRLTQLSQDYIEELLWHYLRKIGEKFKRPKPKEPETPKLEPKEQPTEEEKASSEESSDLEELLEQMKEPINNNNNDDQVETSAHDAMFFHTTIFCVWCLVAIINVPSALTWAHNFKYGTALHPDPSFLPGLVLSACALPLWQLDWPRIERKGYREVGLTVNVLAVASLVYAPISIFRLNYTLTGAIVVVTLHQLVAPNREAAGDSTRQRPNLYEMIKAKLE